MERKVSTAKLAIGGGAGFPDSEDGVQRWIKAHMAAGRDADRTAGLLTRYGTRAEEVIRFLDGAPEPTRTGSCTPPANSASANWSSWPRTSRSGTSSTS